ncbi:14 kDa phosphohistidine phosphatase isoform X1 [Callithrix jacchus]
MAAAGLAHIPDVDIDSDGVFKYVLIRIHSAPRSGAPAAESKEIVRGYKWAEYHASRGFVSTGEGAVQSWDFTPPSAGWEFLPWLPKAARARPEAALPSQRTSTTKCRATCRSRAVTVSVWAAGASPTRARTRRFTCTATPWPMVLPSTPFPPRKSKPSTPTTRSPGLTTATEHPQPLACCLWQPHWSPCVCLHPSCHSPW